MREQTKKRKTRMKAYDAVRSDYWSRWPVGSSTVAGRQPETGDGGVSEYSIALSESWRRGASQTAPERPANCRRKYVRRTFIAPAKDSFGP